MTKDTIKAQIERIQKKHKYKSLGDKGKKEITAYIKLCDEYGIKARIPQSGAIGVTINKIYYNPYHLELYLSNHVVQLQQKNN